jgi:hypothetical protein
MSEERSRALLDEVGQEVSSRRFSDRRSASDGSALDETTKRIPSDALSELRLDPDSVTEVEEDMGKKFMDDTGAQIGELKQETEALLQQAREIRTTTCDLLRALLSTTALSNAVERAVCVQLAQKGGVVSDAIVKAVFVQNWNSLVRLWTKNNTEACEDLPEPSAMIDKFMGEVETVNVNDDATALDLFKTSAYAFFVAFLTRNPNSSNPVFTALRDKFQEG